MYKVKVKYFNEAIESTTIFENLTLEQAQATCSNKEASSRTCTKEYLKERTRSYGPWFLLYYEY